MYLLDKEKLSHTVVSVLGIIILGVLFFKYAFRGFLPIILGWLISLVIYPLGERLSRKTKMSKRALSGILVVVFFVLIILLTALGIRRLFFELQLFAGRLQSNPEIIENALENIKNGFSRFRLFAGLEKIVSSLGEYAYIADEIINNILNSLMTAMGDFLSAAATNIVLGIPTALLFLITLILSAFYFCVDRDKIYAFLGSLIPEGVKNKIVSFTQGGARAAAGYIKSSLILMMITFLEMLVFLTLLQVEYSLILSIIIAVVDVLPLLGVGAVLVPWSIYCFIIADVRMGVWLLVIFLAATVLRNILEPRILGKKIGVHPFLILSSAYLGFILLGGVGLLAGPIIAATLGTAKLKEK